MDNSAQMEMPKYQSHKKVWALKIKKLEEPLPSGDCMFTPEDKGYGAVFLPKDYMQKHDPKEGGYYIVYEGGYQSFSPAEPFESGYTKI